MCKHILNAQVSIRSPCCKRWFDCPQCHAESSDHTLRKTLEMVFACKKCRKVFRKDMQEFEEEDEYCPHCDNQYIIPAQTAEMAKAGANLVEIDPRTIHDDRVRPPTEEELLDLLNDGDVSSKLG
ncbi:hypothetical protein BDF19DRAFT_68773 [Syncephalis fuscata]|nr:hypothetical protein BDF19DRAFT_68773 [Syncephalis fuscata]